MDKGFVIKKERIKQIGKFLELRMIIHRNVEYDTPWTTEEKMIQELYDNYLNLLIEYRKQKEVIDKINSILQQEKNPMTSEFHYDILGLINSLLDILKEV